MFASSGERGEPCGMPRRLSRASVVRVVRPRSSVSSTGQSSHILIRCSTRRSTTRRATDFWSESPGGACTHWKAPPCHGAHPFQPLAALHPVRTWEDTKLLLVHALGHLRDLSRRSFDPALYPSDRQPALDFVRSALRGETN